MSISLNAMGLPANVGGMGWMSWYDKLMKNRVATVNKWIESKSSVRLVLRWALERVQARVATAQPVAESSRVDAYLRGENTRIPHLFDQAP